MLFDMTPKPTRHSGFTLIEVMIVVAIIAILAAIALPSYRDHVLRGKISVAVSELESMRPELERYFQDNRTFAAKGAASPPCLTARNIDSFSLSCTAPTTNEYLVEATGSGVANGFTYTINQINARNTTAVPAGSGYVTCTNSNGWMIKRGQAC